MAWGGACAWAPIAFADTQEERPAPAGWVTVVLVGVPDVASFPARLRSLFPHGAGLKFETGTSLDPDRILRPRVASSAEAWITLPRTDLARVYFVVSDDLGSGQRFLVREIALPGGFDELGKERVAAVVHAGILALREGQVDAGRATIEEQLRADAAPSAPYAAPHPPPRRRTPAPGQNGPTPRQPRAEPLSPALTAALGYGGTWRGHEPPAHGVEAWLSVLMSSTSPRLGGTLSARHLVRSTARLPSLSLTVDGLRLRTGPALRVDIVRKLGLELGVGGGIDWVRYSSKGSDTVEAARGDDELRTFANVYYGLSYHHAPIAVVLLQELDVALQDTHYDVVTGTRREQVVEAAQVQPGLSLLLGWALR